MERLWARFPVQTDVVKPLDSRWRGCGSDSQFTLMWSRRWTLDGEVVDWFPVKPPPPNQSPSYSNTVLQHGCPMWSRRWTLDGEGCGLGLQFRLMWSRHWTLDGEGCGLGLQFRLMWSRHWTLDGEGCGLGLQFRLMWSRHWTLDGEVVGLIPSSGSTLPPSPPIPQPSTTLQQHSASVQAARFLPTLRTQCYKLKYETKVTAAWVTTLGLGGNCLESRTDLKRKAMHSQEIKNRRRKKIYAFAWNQEQTQKENLRIHVESRTDSEFGKVNLRICMESRTDSERQIYAFTWHQEQTQKENLCIRMESWTDLENLCICIWSRTDSERKSMPSHWIKNRIRKKIHAFACMHLSSGTAGCQFIALTFKIGLTTRSLNLRETVMSSDSSSSEKTEREKKNSYKW